jgi:hypothetical protein
MGLPIEKSTGDKIIDRVRRRDVNFAGVKVPWMLKRFHYHEDLKITKRSAIFQCPEELYFYNFNKGEEGEEGKFELKYKDTDLLQN